MKRMLVTGGTGFVGSKVAYLYGDRYEILAPSHSEMDIADADAVEAYFEAHRPDVVVHCAAVADVGTCQREEAYSRSINVTGSENIARAAGKIGAKCVMCSSDQVYCAGESMEPHKEEEELAPTNIYGQQKLYSEKSCLQMNPDSVHLRLAWMYDPEDTKYLNRGDFVRNLKEGVRGERELVFPVNDYRGITNVWEVVRNMEKALELPGGVYNFGSSNDRSTYDTVLAVLQRCHFDPAKVQKNEAPMGNGKRNLTMCQEKLNRYGIYFASTIDGVELAMKEWSLQ